MPNPIVILTGDGKPMQCPTLRGVRLGQHSCAQEGARRGKSCRWSAIPSKDTTTRVCLKSAYFKSGGRMSWGDDDEVFHTPVLVCRKCPHNLEK